MKNTLLLLFGFLSLYARFATAACPGHFEGEAPPYRLMITTTTDCGDSYGMLLIYKINAQGLTEGDSQIFDVSKECEFPENGLVNTLEMTSVIVACKPGGKSPLAGALFKAKKKPKNLYCETITFVCTKGCDQPLVPKLLFFDHECGE